MTVTVGDAPAARSARRALEDRPERETPDVIGAPDDREGAVGGDRRVRGGRPGPVGLVTASLDLDDLASVTRRAPSR